MSRGGISRILLCEKVSAFVALQHEIALVVAINLDDVQLLPVLALRARLRPLKSAFVRFESIKVSTDKATPLA
jgi:hypothetical protein